MGVELLYSSVKTVEFELQLEASGGRESHTRPKGLGALMNWGPEKMLIRCSKESQHPAEWTPGPPVEHQENDKDTTLTAIRVGVKILEFLFGLQLPLKRKPWVTFSNPCNKVRGKYFVKEVFLCLFIIVSLWCCRWRYNTVWRQILKNPKTGLYFRTCEDGAGWHLISCRISPNSEFFLGPIRAGILCGGLIHG